MAMIWYVTSSCSAITEFYGYNKDRVILITKNNIAVFLHVDDVKNFELLKDFARKIEEKLKDI
jgi:hypothetical protein